MEDDLFHQELPQVDQRQLRHFLAVAEYGQFQRAADVLGLSKQGISRSIAAMEGQLGIQLFTRTNQGVECTDFGRVLIRHAKVILSEYQHAARDLSALKEPASGEVRVGFGASFSEYAGPLVIRRFQARYPDAQIKIENIHPDVLVSRLADGALDLVAASINPSIDIPQSVESVRLFSVEYGVFCSTSHPLIRKKGILPLTALADHPWVTVWRSDRTRRHIVEAFRHQNLRAPERFLFCNDFGLTRRMVLQEGYLVFANACHFEIEMAAGLIKKLNVPDMTTYFDATLLFRPPVLTRPLVKGFKEEIERAAEDIDQPLPNSDKLSTKPKKARKS